MAVHWAFTKAHEFIACNTESLAITMMPAGLVRQLHLIHSEADEKHRIACELLHGMSGIGDANLSQYVAYIWLWSHHGHLFSPKLDA